MTTHFCRKHKTMIKFSIFFLKMKLACMLHLLLTKTHIIKHFWCTIILEYAFLKNSAWFITFWDFYKVSTSTKTSKQKSQKSYWLKVSFPQRTFTRVNGQINTLLRCFLIYIKIMENLSLKITWTTFLVLPDLIFRFAW